MSEQNASPARTVNTTERSGKAENVPSSSSFSPCFSPQASSST